MSRFFVLFFMLVTSNCFAVDVASVKDVPTSVTVSPMVVQPSFSDRLLMKESVDTSIQNFRVKCDVAFYSEKNGKEEKVDLSGDVIGYRQGWFKANISYGVFDVIDFGLSPRNVVLKMSRDNVSYVGTLEEAKQGKKMARILSMDISGLKLLFPEAWDSEANCRFVRTEKDQKVVYVCLRDGQFIKPIKKICFRVDKGKELISKIIRYEDKEVSSIVEYNDYRDFPVGNDSPVLVPSEVILNVDPKTKFIFAIKTIEINRPDKPNETKVWPSEANEVRKFSQMRE